MTGRGRELSLAVAGCALAGALGLVSGGRTWLDIVIARGAPLPSTNAVLTGSAVAPVVGGLGILLLAGVVGLLATRALGRILVGIVLAAAGAGIIAAAIPWLGTVSAARVRGVAFDAGLPAGDVTGAAGSVGPWLALSAGVLAVGTGLLAAVRGRWWPGMGQRYDAPTAARAVPASTAPAEEHDPTADRRLWDALDLGEDPTRSRTPHPSD